VAGNDSNDLESAAVAATFAGVITLRLDADTVTRIRLSCSPASEAMYWLGIAVTGTRHRVSGDPGPAALDHPDVALLAELVPPQGPDDAVLHLPAQRIGTAAPGCGKDLGAVIGDARALLACRARGGPLDTTSYQLSAMHRVGLVTKSCDGRSCSTSAHRALVSD
jgi:hypothetical protein